VNGRGEKVWIFCRPCVGGGEGYGQMTIDGEITLLRPPWGREKKAQRSCLNPA